MELHTPTDTFGGEASTRKCLQKVGLLRKSVLLHDDQCVDSCKSRPIGQINIFQIYTRFYITRYGLKALHTNP